MMPPRRVLPPLLAAGALACTPGADASPRPASTADVMTRTANTESTRAAVLRVALNQHLRTVLAQSSVALDPGNLGDAASVMITEPTRVTYADPRDPTLLVELGTGRFVAIDQAGAWVYGLTFTPQLRATPIDEAVAAARGAERAFAATAWRQDTATLWRAGDDTVQRWVRGDDAELPIARFTAGSAEAQITLKRTGAPSPSERLRGKAAETFYANVQITDMAHADAYEARVLRQRRASGDGSRPLPLAAFMNDTTPP